MKRMRMLRSVALIAVGFFGTGVLRADEGMWLLNAPPVQQMQERYGFAPSPAWLEHVQKASVRFNSGGSGAFVSPDGLIVTNHHVARDDIYKLSSEKNDYLRDGFYAKTRADELRCIALELNVLMASEDVTARVNAVVKPDMDAASAFAARRAEMAKIEKESMDATGLRSDIVTLYQGARYHLYRYKKYTDIRLVFAPEQQAAFFGGDPDNFEFPRHDLDFCILRAYENGAPAKIEHYLKWSVTGAGAGELVFVTGHPGSTSRLFTYAELAYTRDRHVPDLLRWLKTNEVLLLGYGARAAESARRGHDLLFVYQNARKVYDGKLAALLDPAMFDRKRKEEERLKKAAADRAELAAFRSAWADIEAAQKTIAHQAGRYNLLEYFADRSSVPLKIARTLYRAAMERTRPSGERLREYRETNLASLELELFSTEPLYDDLEQVRLAGYLTQLAVERTADDPLVKAALAGKTPADRAAELLAATRVKDVAARKQLYALDPEEMNAAADGDPLLGLARILDGEARAAREIMEEQNEIKKQAHAKIARVRYALEGTRMYPDATFTLRFAYGTILGYEDKGETIRPFTTMGGVYERSAEHNGREPFDLAPRWAEREGRVKMDTPMNFASTCDITGGNSGSPTINRAGEFVGIVFDGNIYSTAADYTYDEKRFRAISVDARAIVEALRTIYDAGDLADELLGRR